MAFKKAAGWMGKAAVCALATFACGTSAQSPSGSETNVVFGSDAIILPEPIPDRIEPVNRALWKFNQALLRSVIQPSSKVYRAIVPTKVRRGIRNAGKNLNYPRNAINNLLQANWTGARNETYRFLLNTAGGVGGLFDVATPSGIRAAEADFGQTFRDWGWHPDFYLMVPITGPSNERDVVGSLTDGLVYPLTYVAFPWSYFGLGFTYNNLTDTVDDYIRVAKADYDPYNVLRYAWSINREHRPGPLPAPANHDVPSLETLQSILFRTRDAKFAERGSKRFIDVAATGKKLPFTLWMQPRKAPLVFIAPGFASHRLSGGAIALAELLYNSGFSVATISSTFNHEFMGLAASTPLPGYTPVDAQDLHSALAKINESIEAKYPHRVTTRALLGFSMGGFQTLYLAGGGTTNMAPQIHFDRYVAINPPVRLDYSIDQLDKHFASALNWPAAERTAHIESTFHKVAELARYRDVLTPNSPIPLNADESKFLVGLAFRVSLRDIIFQTQLRTNQGVLHEEVDVWNRDPVYREILQVSFDDYLEKFVTPYYQTRGVNLDDPKQLAKAVRLPQFENQLRTNQNVRVIANANDLLLAEEDARWLRETLGNRLMLFERGGHLGNLSETIVQQQIVRALADLLPPL
ncbi:MAG TPA: MlaA family lipoprotein, partial [Chthoniobacteraceae bacterium]|nr:MlaA family lipoprotein [Chthoniobacteraceae bacterium]